MRSLFLLGSLCLAASVNLAAPLAFEAVLSLNASTGLPSYSVWVGSDVVFSGSEIAVHLSGKACAAKSCLASTTATPQTIKGIHRSLGAYEGTSIEWKASIAGNIPVVTSIKNFPSSNAIVFETNFPAGANGTACDDVDASSVIFPAFQGNVFSSALSWHGSFTQSVRGFSKGRRGGPTVFYGATTTKQSSSEVLSTTSNRAPLDRGLRTTQTHGLLEQLAR